MLLKKNIPLKYVFGKIKWEVLFISIYAGAVGFVHNYFGLTAMTIPLSVPMILGTVISMLLAFRSSQAYDRWWEARTIWGAIVNDSRTLARQILSFIDTEYSADELEQFRKTWLRRQIAWCYSLSHSLRDNKGTKGLERLVSKRELSHVAKYDNVPMALLELHSRDLNYALRQNWLNQYQQVEMDRTLTRLTDAMGKCERIKNTVFPATYSLYIHFAMNFFILMLPFALIDVFGWMEAPMVVIISALFLLIEKMAIHLQDPFEGKPTDTPMTTISQTIEKNLRQMMDDHYAVEPAVHEVTRYYVL